mgnify:FL=1
MIINIPDFEYSYSNEVAKRLIENSDVVDFICYIDNLRLLVKYYKNDRKSYDLACEIADSIGFSNFLKRKHTYDELVDYYNDSCCLDKDDDMGLLAAETVQEDVKQETVKKPLLDVNISGDYKIIDDTKQTKDVIEMSKEKRAALLMKKPNVKCDL